MSSKKPYVVVTHKLPDDVEHRMAELFDAHFLNATGPLPEDELIDALQKAEVLVPTITDSLDAQILSAGGPQLKMIANFGNGVDHIDVTAAHAKGIIVTNTPSVTTNDAADMTMALILAVPRRLIEGASLLHSGAQWPGWSPTWMLGRRLTGKKLGIIGMGRIGQAVARRALPFGLEINYHARRPIAARTEQEFAATYWGKLEDMLPEMDIISVNCPYTPETFHLLSRQTLALLKPHAYVVNTARGEVIDQEALIDALEREALAGAALDVFENEPALDPRLLRLARSGKAVLLPHLASATLEGRIDMGEKVIINIQVYADGHRPPDRVLPILHTQSA